MGKTPCGITWTIESVNAPRQIGFRSDAKNFTDQIHHVVAIVPSSCSIYANGSLTLAFQAITDENLDNESAGVDNLRIIAQN